MEKSGLSNSHRGPHIHCCLVAYRPAKMSHFGEVPGKVFYHKDNKKNRFNIKKRETGIKIKRSKFLVIASGQVKSASRYTNSSVICKQFNDGRSCTWELCEKTHKCKECESKDNGLIECVVKERKKS